jgi:hypothetical protein
MSDDSKLVLIDRPNDGVPPYVICETDCSEWYATSPGKMICHEYEVDALRNKFQHRSPIDPNHKPRLSGNVRYRRDTEPEYASRCMWVKDTFVVCDESTRYTQWALNMGFPRRVDLPELIKQSSYGHRYATESLLALAGF